MSLSNFLIKRKIIKRERITSKEYAEIIKYRSEKDELLTSYSFLKDSNIISFSPSTTSPFEIINVSFSIKPLFGEILIVASLIDSSYSTLS